MLCSVQSGQVVNNMYAGDMADLWLLLLLLMRVLRHDGAQHTMSAGTLKNTTDVKLMWENYPTYSICPPLIKRL